MKAYIPALANFNGVITRNYNVDKENVKRRTDAILEQLKELKAAEEKMLSSLEEDLTPEELQMLSTEEMTIEEKKAEKQLVKEGYVRKGSGAITQDYRNTRYHGLSLMKKVLEKDIEDIRGELSICLIADDDIQIAVDTVEKMTEKFEEMKTQKVKRYIQSLDDDEVLSTLEAWIEEARKTSSSVLEKLLLLKEKYESDTDVDDVAAPGSKNDSFDSQATLVNESMDDVEPSHDLAAGDGNRADSGLGMEQQVPMDEGDNDPATSQVESTHEDEEEEIVVTLCDANDYAIHWLANAERRVEIINDENLLFGRGDGNGVLMAELKAHKIDNGSFKCGVIQCTECKEKKKRSVKSSLKAFQDHLSPFILFACRRCREQYRSFEMFKLDHPSVK